MGNTIEANTTFTELHSRGYAHEALQLNWAACLVLLSLTPQGLEDWELLEKTKSIVNDLVLTRGKSTEHTHALAVLHALLAKTEVGANQNTLLDRTLFWESRALGIDLPKGKALAIGHVLPAANERKPLLQLIKKILNSPPI